jgi:heat shock protein HtpX
MADAMSHTADWRAQIRKNQRRTLLVISCFILLYLLLGLLIDLYYYSTELTAQGYVMVPLRTILKNLLTFKLFPTFTLLVGAIAVVSLFVVLSFSNRLMLLGTEYCEITPESAANMQERQLYNVVEEMKVAAGLQFMPRVYIINADYMNAFASGYTEKSAMVAITRGLMEKLDRSEMQAVMAHELSHIRHLDIKLTMMAALLSNLILIIIDLLFYSVIYGRDRKGNSGLLTIIVILRYALPIVTGLLLLYLSRTREYMADAGCVELMRDNGPLASALLKIHGDHVQNQEQYSSDYSQTAHENIRREAYLYDPVVNQIQGASSPTDFFSTHPSIERRLAAIGVQMPK